MLDNYGHLRAWNRISNEVTNGLHRYPLDPLREPPKEKDPLIAPSKPPSPKL